MRFENFSTVALVFSLASVVDAFVASRTKNEFPLTSNEPGRRRRSLRFDADLSFPFLNKIQTFSDSSRCRMLIDDQSSEKASEFSVSNFTTSSSVQFGDVVPMQRPGGKIEELSQNDYLIPTTTDESSVVTADATEISLQEESRQRNLVVAVASVILAVSSYFWQFTHPITPVQLLFTMQQNSQPIEVIGVNGKPSVVDFWAPWCENCKLIAPTLQKVEEEYKDRVNFVMVDGDKAESWPYIEAFGVDAIPHLALVSAEGDVETALIGPIPKHVLEADLDMLIANAKNSKQELPQQPLPYRMLDVFARNPEQRRVRFP